LTGFKRTVGVALALSAATAAVLLGGCGGDENSGSTTSAPVHQGVASGGQKPLPADAPISEVLARQFPKPKPQPNTPPGARKAIDAGRRACMGKTPAQVRDEFMAEAKASGLLNPGQIKMISQLDHFEKQATNSPDFVAGQLAAGVYEATLPEDLRTSGYQGCVYELARQLERELAKG
jgi:hypothetical protein